MTRQVEWLDPQDMGLQAVARELEAYADDTRVTPPPDLVDRIMSAVSAQLVPTPPVAFLHAVWALALADAWRAWRLNLRVALGAGTATGRLRSQALAVVITSLLIVGIGGATVAVGAARIVEAIVTPTLTDPDATPTPSPEVTPRPDATPSPDASPSPSPSTSPDESDEPEESESPDESGGSGQGDGRSSGPGGGGGGSSGPAETDDPEETEEPESDDSGSGGGSGSDSSGSGSDSGSRSDSGSGDD